MVNVHCRRLVLSAFVAEQAVLAERTNSVNSSEAIIDTAAVVANWRMLASIASGSAAAAVVKADGYGLGAATLGRALMRAGCRRFYVAWPLEGVSLRQALGGEPEIAVLNAFAGGGPKPFIDFSLQPVLNSMEDVLTWVELGPDRPPAAIHIDTGMNRLGLPLANWPGAAEATRLAPPRMIVSHLACADEPGHPMNRSQLTSFREGATLWPGVPRSLSATAGVYLGTEFALEEIRPGIGLYGGGPPPPAGHRLATVVTLRTPVLQVRSIESGESVGYGATFTAAAPARLATIGIGYADGFLRAASNRGYAVVQGEKRPILGRVSMDLVVLDVTGLSVSQGDPVELIGPAMPVEEQAAAMSTIDYELLTRLGSRVRRVYTGEA